MVDGMFFPNELVDTKISILIHNIRAQARRLRHA
jgi:hypothetical protein